MDDDRSELVTEVISETANNMIWKANEPDDETTYHLVLNNVTIQFFRDEWDEFLELIKGIA
jgi:hypothetical protein